MGIFNTAARGLLTRLSESEAPDRQVYGGTGTLNYSGYLYGHEYNTELQSVRLIDIVDRMLADGTVWSTYLLTTLPVRSAQWAVDPGENEQAGEFVESVLFDRRTDTWDEFLSNALLSLAYGRMVFEKVWDFDPESRMWYWKTLSPRLPRTIYRWVLDTNTDGQIGRAHV